MTDHRIKTVLIILVAIALALGILTAFVVFYPAGTYQTVSLNNTSSSSLGTSYGSPTGIATTTNAFQSTTPATAATPSLAGQFSSEYSSPYPVSWNESSEKFSVTGAMFQGDKLTLTLAIQMGGTPECVPLNVRLVADEIGTLRAPDSPAGSSFAFPDTQSCNGTPGAIYSESLIFNVASVPSPFLFTTGGASNTFFTAATSTAGGVDIVLPSHSG